MHNAALRTGMVKVQVYTEDKQGDYSLKNTAQIFVNAFCKIPAMHTLNSSV